MVEQVPDTLDGDIRWRQGVHDFCVVHVLALAWNHRCDALSPDLLDRVRDAQLVIDQNVVVRITSLDVI